ncbi:hypothetical protein Tco_1165154 [Tanacetum coccineum]
MLTKTILSLAASLIEAFLPIVAEPRGNPYMFHRYGGDETPYLSDGIGVESYLRPLDIITRLSVWELGYNGPIDELEELNSENDFEKENSGSTIIHTDISLLEYESFDNESDSASDIFNDDLAHIISPSEYDYVYADDESDSGDSTRKLQMSHRDFKALKISHNLFNKSPMMIYGGDMPILDVLYLHFYLP